MLEAGDRAPEFTLRAVNGTPHGLRDALEGGHHALLVFLRHLG